MKLRLLALLLYMKNDNITDLKHRFSIGSDDHFRQTKARLKSAFCKLTGISDEKVFSATEASSGIPIVCNEILIFGAVEKKALDYR